MPSLRAEMLRNTSLVCSTQPILSFCQVRLTARAIVAATNIATAVASAPDTGPGRSNFQRAGEIVAHAVSSGGIPPTSGSAPQCPLPPWTLRLFHTRHKDNVRNRTYTAVFDRRPSSRCRHTTRKVGDAADTLAV